jgi:predicted phage tail protein
LEALTSLETILQAVLGAAALAVAVWSAARSFSSPKTGEIAWTVVAVAILAGVSLAAGIGHGV